MSDLPLTIYFNFVLHRMGWFDTVQLFFATLCEEKHKGSHQKRKTVKKVDNFCTGKGGLPQFINFSLILPGPQITWECHWQIDHKMSYLSACLMCGIWDWQSTIVKDLNDSQDPKHTLFCRKNAFVSIYAFF